MKHKILSVIFFGQAAGITANWIDWSLNPVQPYGYTNLAKLALVGCAVMAFTCILSFFSLRYARWFGICGVLLAWPYFGVLAANVPWGNLGWVIQYHYHGVAQVSAVLSLFLTTVYSAFEVGKKLLSTRCITVSNSAVTL